MFNEITADAVLGAMGEPRDIDMDLVNAQLARRALDYLIGFTLSPVLWHKLPGCDCKSAGRVQSVALRLICEREAEIERFTPREYWSVDADLATGSGEPFTARLVRLDGTKLEKFTLADEATALEAAAGVREGRFIVDTIERKEVGRNPPPPFTTSTLQQDASRRFGTGVQQTMRVAQRLYEGRDIGSETTGLITYMRTDSVVMSQTAVSDARRLVTGEFGERYLPGKPRVYRTKSRNAQEAHEAIRPTDFSRTPKAMARYLERDEARLYELIWKRALASQMERARFDQTAVDIGTTAGEGTGRDIGLRVTGSVMTFDGFMKLYRESTDDNTEDDGDRRLPALKEGEPLEVRVVRPDQHFTEPPPRLTEASLVKRLEELGIGRPSTYAPIIGVLKNKEYVHLEKKRFHPADRGRLLIAFLETFFRTYVEYDFTANMEQDLDRISGGNANWKAVLREFWDAFDRCDQGNPGSRDQAHTRRGRNCHGAATSSLSRAMLIPGPVLPAGMAGCISGSANSVRSSAVRPGRSAASPRIRSPGKTEPRPTMPVRCTLATILKPGFRSPSRTESSVPMSAGARQDRTPARRLCPATWPTGRSRSETALGLLALPREVGVHPESGKTVLAGVGRFGPYLKHGGQYINLADDDVLAIGLNRAVTLIAEESLKKSSVVLKELGEHPSDQAPVEVRKGRYGPYVKHKRANVSLPKGTNPEVVTLETALELLARKKPARSTAASKTGKQKRKAPRKAADGSTVTG